MYIKDKSVGDMIELVFGGIEESVLNYKVDAVVNSANPTLMGSKTPSVDRKIHEMVNNSLDGTKQFKDIIREEVDEGKDWGENIVRCKRGEIVITSGGDWCKYVMHVVGTKYDGKISRKYCEEKISPFCTSSCVFKLERCYKNIVKAIEEHPDISSIAVPVISAGNYGFPFELAVKIAIASLGNQLVEWKNRDTELFNKSSFEKIYLYVYDAEESRLSGNGKKAEKILNNYKRVFFKDNKVVYQNSAIAHFRYLMEVCRNDSKRGYFAIARIFRLILLLIRVIFLPILLIKDLRGKCDWQKRRQTVEIISFIKLFIPLFFYYMLGILHINSTGKVIIIALLIYFMADTITYLILLIVLSDIQRPSANVIRSMIFLFINYWEVGLDFSLIYYVLNSDVGIFNAIKFGIDPNTIVLCTESMRNNVLLYTNQGTKFFFMTLAFGYFVNHLRQREFLVK